jgi:hypothetical protein
VHVGKSSWDSVHVGKSSWDSVYVGNSSWDSVYEEILLRKVCMWEILLEAIWTVYGKFFEGQCVCGKVFLGLLECRKVFFGQVEKSSCGIRVYVFLVHCQISERPISE